jgi:hypothetical protein
MKHPCSHSGQSRTPRKKRWDGAYAVVDFLAPVATESGGQGGCCRPRLELTRLRQNYVPKKLEQDIPVI